MANVTIDFADGSSHTYENVPSTATPDQVQARAEKDFAGKGIKHIARGAAPAPKAPVEKPGFLEPGSKSEAVVRGFSQGATLGYGDEAQALIRRVAPEMLGGAPAGQTYEQLRDEQRTANDASMKAQPATYIGSNVAAALPSFGAAQALRGGAAILGGGTKMGSLVRGSMQTPTVMGAAKTGATLGAVTGLGGGEGDLESQLGSTLGGAALGAVATGGAAGASRLVNKGAASVAGTGMRGGPLQTAAANQIADRVSGALVGGAGTGLGGDVRPGAIAGAIVGGNKLGKLAGPASQIAAYGLQKAAPAIRSASSQAGRLVSTSSATQQALMEMSSGEARKVRAEGDAKMEAAVRAGKPVYAATFAVKANNPAYRVATQSPEEIEDEED